MQGSNHESYPYQTDEIDLIKLFNSLLARKLLIVGLTGLVTLLAIIYALNLTPTYKATSSVTSPSDYSILYINKLPLTIENKNSVFSNFLSSLSSREFQTKIFLDGDYLTALNPEKEPIDDVIDYASDFLKSISIEQPPVTRQAADEIVIGNLLESPYTISLKGSNDEIISRYLNELIIAADNRTIKEIINLVKHKIDVRLDQISIERKLLVAKAKQQRLNEIIILTSAAQIANSLGIVDNNFKQINNDGLDSSLSTQIGDNQVLPEWYLYGEKALQEKINILKNRTSDGPFVPKTVDLDNEALALELIVIDTGGVNSMQLNQTASSKILPLNKRKIVLTAFFAGFIMSILLALALNALKPDEKNSA
jgi:LPS O-antigen subunit length determinant protein (WzzB/FepE family)